jgi:hypothetical protein
VAYERRPPAVGSVESDQAVFLFDGEEFGRELVERADVL